MWVKLDDQFPDHPKVIAAGGDAAWLYVAGLCYCQAKLTDGRIPAAVVPRLTDRRQPMKLAERLVEVELWEADEDAFWVHDYHDHNAAAEEIKARREANRNRVSEWRMKQAGNGVGNAVTDDVRNDDVTPPPRAQSAIRNPLTASKLKNNTAQPGLREPLFDFAAVYAAYPRKVGKTPGLKICARQIKTPADYADLERAVAEYAHRIRRDGTELRFVLHFSTFMGRWRDFLEPEAPEIGAQDTNGTSDLGRQLAAKVLEREAAMHPDVPPKDAA